LFLAASWPFRLCPRRHLKMKIGGLCSCTRTRFLASFWPLSPIEVTPALHSGFPSCFNRPVLLGFPFSLTSLRSELRSPYTLFPKTMLQKRVMPANPNFFMTSETVDVELALVILGRPVYGILMGVFFFFLVCFFFF